MRARRITYLILFSLLSGYSANLYADVPDGYYARIDGLKKADLKAAVKASIRTGKSTLSYNDLWSYYENIDVVPGTTNQVFDYYSDRKYFFKGNGAAPTDANKEHCCPQSWWGGGSSSDSYSDLFNVMPSDSEANNRKSNFPVGVVGSKVTYSNPCMKVGPSAGNGYSDNVFEPCDEYKGDFARVYLYVATCYDQSAWGSKASVASTCAFVKEAYPTIKKDFLALLLRWHRQDPVSEWEIARNERVYKYQHNRNPFIDYPQLAEYIWGDSTSFAFDLQKAKVNGYGSRSDIVIDDNNDDDDDDGHDDKPIDDDKVTLPPGTVIYAETFDEVTEGKNTDTGGSSSPWSGNDIFTDVNNVYQAGEAVRLGSSKKAGSLISCPLDFPGGTLAVSIEVKGWSNVEGNLTITMSGSSAKTLSYTATLRDAFETVNVIFDEVSAHPILMIATTQGRCFINSVKIVVPETSGIEQLADEDLSSPCVDLIGRPSSASQDGLYIKSNKLIYIRK